MAITRPLTATPVTEEDRTWRANIETPRDGKYSIQVYRERLQKDASGNVVSAAQDLAPITRNASAIADESVTVGEQIVPAALVLAALPLFFDRWAEENAKPPA